MLGTGQCSTELFKNNTGTYFSKSRCSAVEWGLNLVWRQRSKMSCEKMLNAAEMLKLMTVWSDLYKRRWTVWEELFPLSGRTETRLKGTEVRHLTYAVLVTPEPVFWVLWRLLECSSFFNKNLGSASALPRFLQSATPSFIAQNDAWQHAEHIF